MNLDDWFREVVVIRLNSRQLEDGKVLFYRRNPQFKAP